MPEEVQLKRAMQRDDNDEAQIRRIMAVQMARADKVERADIVIDNSGSLDDLNSRVEELHGEFLRLVNPEH